MTKIYKRETLPQQAYINPILTRRDDTEYRYRLIRRLLQDRSKKYQEYLDKELQIPYAFIVGILKHYVHEVDMEKPLSKQGNTSRLFLLARSKKRDFAIGVLMVIKDFEITVYDVQKLISNSYKQKTVELHKDALHIYIDDLDLDEYVENIKAIQKNQKKEIRKKALRENNIFHQEGDFFYLYSLTKHIYTSRSYSKGMRLTLPQKAVSDILKYLMTDEMSRQELLYSLQGVKNEKQIAIVLCNREKSHLIGLLVAFDVGAEDFMLATVITMYDSVPEDKSAQKLLFPKIERISLYDYDLEEFMANYDIKQTEKERDNKALMERRLKEAKENPRAIVKVSSYDEYYEKYGGVKKVNSASLVQKKIRRVYIEQLDMSDNVNAKTSTSSEILKKKNSLLGITKQFFERLVRKILMLIQN